ncbi:MAG: hypothetical protein QGG36_05355 [Pirellulaceae bacterium]|jgi:hypothetical protein|nr:hypothetical protein [Pirellulaceae bacterium]MDP7015201.1 hypothetical protein [Pirellulaceae bacterium]
MSSKQVGVMIMSGLPVGARATQFEVQDCTGPAAGRRVCYFCRYGRRPTVTLFVRDLNDEVGALVKGIDERVRKHRDARLAAFVVLLADNPFEASRRLKRFADQHEIKSTPLTVFSDRPNVLRNEYKISSDAQLTVLMWSEVRVRANHAFGSDAFERADCPEIWADVDKLVSPR